MTIRETEFAEHVIMCLANGKVPSKSAAAQRMMLSLSTVERKEYQGLNIEEKKSYRKRWVEMNLLLKYTVTRTENEAWKTLIPQKVNTCPQQSTGKKKVAVNMISKQPQKHCKSVLQWVHLGYGTTA